MGRAISARSRPPSLRHQLTPPRKSRPRRVHTWARLRRHRRLRCRHASALPAHPFPRTANQRVQRTVARRFEELAGLACRRPTRIRRLIHALHPGKNPPCKGLCRMTSQVGIGHLARTVTDRRRTSQQIPHRVGSTSAPDEFSRIHRVSECGAKDSWRNRVPHTQELAELPAGIFWCSRFAHARITRPSRSRPWTG